MHISKKVLNEIREKAWGKQNYYQSLDHAKKAMDNFVKSGHPLWFLTTNNVTDEDALQYYGTYIVVAGNEHVILSVKEIYLGDSPKTVTGKTVACTKSKINGKYFTYHVSAH